MEETKTPVPTETTTSEAPVAAGQPIAETPTMPARKTDKKKWLAVIGVVLVLLLAILFVGRSSKKEQTVTTSTQQKRTITVSASSEIAGITLSISNKQNLLHFLNKYSFFEQNKVRLFGSTDFKTVTVDKLVVSLSDQGQPLDKLYNNDKKLLSSIGENYSGKDKTLTIVVSIDQSILKNTTDNTTLTQIFSHRLAGFIYYITNFQLGLPQKQAEAEYTKRLKESQLIDNEGTIFSLTRTK